LDDDQVNMIYHSEPILLEINEIYDKVPSWEPGKKYSGYSEGDPLNVINNIYEID